MSSFRFRRFGSIVSAAALALMLVGVGTTSANQPNWNNAGTFVTSVPPMVKTGLSAGYKVYLRNDGPSSIAQLYLTSSLTGSPTYVNPKQGVCNAAGAGPLYCALGSVKKGQQVWVTVAYQTSGSSPFGLQFYWNTTGVTSSDGGSSHGDAKVLDASTALTTSGNFNGGFTTSLAEIATDPVTTTDNQQTKITPPGLFIPVIVADGPSVTYPCPISVPACTSITAGEWSKVEVNDGTQYPNGFKVTIILKLPNDHDADDLPTGVVHFDGTTTYPITQVCNASTLPLTVNGPECVTITYIGGGKGQIIVWLKHNGGLHGTF